MFFFVCKSFFRHHCLGVITAVVVFLLSSLPCGDHCSGRVSMIANQFRDLTNNLYWFEFCLKFSDALIVYYPSVDLN